MNELSDIFVDVCDNTTVTLKKDYVYHVSQDDSFSLTGYYCSNTAKHRENPHGQRFSAIYLKNKKNIVIDGNGATILIHGKMTPLLFDKCKNITVKNLKIDYACPTMTEFTIVSNNNGKCIIRINPECLFEIKGNDIFRVGEADKNGKPYWKSKHTGKGIYLKLYNPDTRESEDFNRNDLEFEAIERINLNTIKVVLKNKNAYFPEGHIMQIRSIVRDQTGSLFQRCNNLKFKNLRIMFMHGLGMVSQFCDTVTFNNCDFTPKEGRTIASTADFFQFSGCKGAITVENCKAQGAHDDYINVHGTHLRIVRKNKKEKSLTLRFMHPETWGFQAFEKGDKIEFIKWNTLKPFSEATVTDYKRLNGTDIKIYIDSPVPELEIKKDVIENATWTPDLYVRNCFFGPTSGRGILCTTRGEVIIENNHFENLWGPALLIEDDCNFWFESGYTNEIIFRNNRVVNCEYAAMWEGSPVIRYSPKVMDENSREFVHGKLTLTDNSFEASKKRKHNIYLEYLKEAEIKNNIFDAPYEITTRKSGEITDSGNIIKDN